MNGPTTAIVLIGVLVFCYLVIRIVGRIASWRLTLTVLAIAILTATGLLNTNPITTEIGHVITNLFGATQ